MKDIFIFTGKPNLLKEINRALNVILGMGLDGPRRHSFYTRKFKKAPETIDDIVAYNNFMEMLNDCDIIIYWPGQTDDYQYIWDQVRRTKRIIAASDIIVATNTIKHLKGAELK